MKKLITFIVFLAFASAVHVYLVQAQSILRPVQGGTGIASTTVGNVGKVLTVSSTNPLVYTFGNAGSGAATTTINGASGPDFTFATGTAGANFNIASSGATITFNCPDASGTVRGCLTSSDWTTFNNKGSGTLTGNGSATRIPIYDTATAFITSANLTFNTSTGVFQIIGIASSTNARFGHGTSTTFNIGNVNLLDSGTGLQISANLEINGTQLDFGTLSPGIRDEGGILFLGGAGTNTNVDGALSVGGSNTSTFYGDGNESILGGGIQIQGVASSSQLRTPSSTVTTSTLTSIIISGDTIKDFTGTGLANISNVLTNIGVLSISTTSPINASVGTGTVALSFTNPGYVTAASSVTWTATSTFNAQALFNNTTTHNSSTIFNGTSLFSNTSTLASSTLITSLLQIPTSTTLASNGQIAVRTGTTTLNYYAGSELALSPTSTLQWIIENPTASEDDAFWIADVAGKITKVTAVNKSLGDTATFNVVWHSSRATATSSAQKAFTSYQAVAATTTASSVSINGSSTFAIGDVLRFSTTAASSSQFTMTVSYQALP